MAIATTIARAMNLRPEQVSAVMALLDEGCTIPFIARYRKEATGGLDDVTLRALEEKLAYEHKLQERKEEVIATLTEQGNLTATLEQQINEATMLQRIEDLYKPFRKKRATRASKAKEAGLDPLALALMAQEQQAQPQELARAYIKPGTDFDSVERVLQGAKDIVAEAVADDPEAVEELRGFTRRTAAVTTKAIGDEAERDYAAYGDFSEAAARIPDHRILAINRGEREKQLRVSLAVDSNEAQERLERRFLRRKSPWTPYMEDALQDGYKRLMAPSLEREVRAQLTERAQQAAMGVFAKNTEALLRQRPVRGARIIALDPGYRTGCKVAVIDEYGTLLDHGTIYLTPPRNDVAGALSALHRWIERYDISVIVVGNGTASRETEAVVAQCIEESSRPVVYTIVNEAGASVYSASEVASAEHPDLDVTTRGALSLGRRLQDPLAELVKIPPQSIGVGQYQHDLDQKALGQTLAGVVERVVNEVGVDLNTASASLLSYVAGITPTIAHNIVAWREEQGPFTNRRELKKVAKLGPKAFQNCAGFLRIQGGSEPLDNTAVHPESYNVAKAVLKKAGLNPRDLAPDEQRNLRSKLGNLSALAAELEVGVPTLNDIVEELERPGRDPRDDAPAPVFSRAVLSMEDLTPGLALTGTVRNVVDFGAFVDIGVKQDGLVHISKLSSSFVKHPSDVVAVGDTVDVWVEAVDTDRGRISLTMVEPH